MNRAILILPPVHLHGVDNEKFLFLLLNTLTALSCVA